MKEEEIKRLSDLLDERTMALMARESDLADRTEELEAQKEELNSVVDELHRRNKSLEVALQELRERNQELDQILYRVSHDLRSPITSIFGILNLMEYEQMTRLQRDYFQHIRERTTGMDNLLNSLSSLSKTILNDIHYTRVDIDLVIRRCISELKHLANFDLVVIRSEINGNPEIVTDQLLFSIVVKNLLTNSVVFREPKKEGSVLIRSHASDAWIEVEIIDDGEGILESIKDRIFDMFYRGSELSKGSGLGLYVVKKIVNQLGGNITFDALNGLTRFRFALPNGEGQFKGTRTIHFNDDIPPST